MGQQCENACFEPNIDPVDKSTQVEQEIPFDSVPEAVKQKIRLLKLKISDENSELWKYEESQNDTNQKSIVIYTLIHQDDIIKPAELNPEPETLIVATSQPAISSSQPGQAQTKINRFDPYRFGDVAIFLFSVKNPSNDQANPYFDSGDKFEFEEFYFGPINEKMAQPNITKIFKTGDFYQGSIEDCLFQGQGKMTNSLGNHSYSGSWSKNKPSGKGVEELDKKFKYDGRFSDGKWNGPGKLTIFKEINQIHYEGLFTNGALQGYGTVKNTFDKLIYEGEFKNSKEHGKGKWYGQNGDSYEGEFVQGQKQGHGTFTFASGGRYEGGFKNGLPEGEGVLEKRGVKIRGHWLNGENILVFEELQEEINQKSEEE